MAAARRDLGIGGYWPLSRFRNEFATGRIDASDLEAVLDAAHPEIDAPITIAGEVSRRAVWRAALRFDLSAIDERRLRWELAEREALIAG